MICNPHLWEFATFYPHVLKVHAFGGEIHQLQDGNKFSIWRHMICEICKNWPKSPISGLQGGRYNLHPLIGGHHCQLDTQCRDPMNNNKDCRVGQLTKSNVSRHVHHYTVGPAYANHQPDNGQRQGLGAEKELKTSEK